MNDSMIEFMDKQEQELVRFECWYHSVIDDMAGLIRANGYEQVMYDVMCAVQRMSEEHSSVEEHKE
jgi:hypothetical protein